jgi:hypothetical protein
LWGRERIAIANARTAFQARKIAVAISIDVDTIIAKESDLTIGFLQRS